MTAFFVLFFVHEASSIIMMTFTLAMQMFVGDHIMYNRGLGIGNILFDITLLAAYFGCLSTTASIISYVKHLQSKLRMSNDSQATMLNGMHEGVLILNQNLDKNDENMVLFCNWPAQKIL